MAKNDWTPYVGTEKVRVGDNLSVRFLSGTDGRMELALLITPETTIDEIRSAWARITEVRELVYQHQGEDPHGARNVFMLRYMAMKEQGRSPAEIARDINEDILAGLCVFVVAERHGDNALPYLRGPSLHLKVMRMKGHERERWINAGLEEIRLGRRPWPPDGGPVDGPRVREALRYIEGKLDSGKTIVKVLPERRTKRAKEFLQANPHFLEGMELKHKLRDFGSASG